MKVSRATDYLMHIRLAAIEACGFVEGMSRDEFFTDRRTRQAVLMNLIIIGEAATKLMDLDPALVAAHPGVPWTSIRGMRNRIAHGYFDVKLEVIWETVQTALPALLTELKAAEGVDGNRGGGQQA